MLTWASYVTVIEDDVNVLEASRVGRLEKACCKEGTKEALWRGEYEGGHSEASTHGLDKYDSV